MIFIQIQRFIYSLLSLFGCCILFFANSSDDRPLRCCCRGYLVECTLATAASSSYIKSSVGIPGRLTMRIQSEAAPAESGVNLIKKHSCTFIQWLRRLRPTAYWQPFSRINSSDFTKLSNRYALDNGTIECLKYPKQSRLWKYFNKLCLCCAVVRVFYINRNNINMKRKTIQKNRTGCNITIRPKLNTHSLQSLSVHIKRHNNSNNDVNEMEMNEKQIITT